MVVAAITKILAVQLFEIVLAKFLRYDCEHGRRTRVERRTRDEKEDQVGKVDDGWSFLSGPGTLQARKTTKYI